MNCSALAADIHNVLQCVAMCCSVLQCVAVCCSVLRCVAVCYSVLHSAADAAQPEDSSHLCCSMLQHVAACCSMLQCAAMYHSVSQCCASLLPSPNRALCKAQERGSLYTARKAPLTSPTRLSSLSMRAFSKHSVSTRTLLRTLRVCTNFTQKFRIKAHSGSWRAANRNLDNTSLH